MAGTEARPQACGALVGQGAVGEADPLHGVQPLHHPVLLLLGERGGQGHVFVPGHQVGQGVEEPGQEVRRQPQLPPLAVQGVGGQGGVQDAVLPGGGQGGVQGDVA